VLDQPWSKPDRTLIPPPEPPLPPNPPAPPPPSCFQTLVPASVYSWWPTGATLLDGGSASEVPSVLADNVVPSEPPEITPALGRESPLGYFPPAHFFPPVQYKGPHTGETLAPGYVPQEFNNLTDT
jgi:hypothetical protein